MFYRIVYSVIIFNPCNFFTLLSFDKAVMNSQDPQDGSKTLVLFLI